MSEEKKQKFVDQELHSNIDTIHPAAFRERTIAEEGNEPGPWWLYAVIIITFATGFFYIGHYLGEVSDRPHVQEIPNMKEFMSGAPAPSTAGGSGQAVEEKKGPLTPEEIAKKGAAVYAGRCAACHQANAQGLPGAFPPLAGSPTVTGGVEKLIAVVLFGLQGPLERPSGKFNNVMPNWGTQLTEEEIAGVVTHLRNNFGNKASAATVEQVQAVKAKNARTAAWTDDELQKTFK